MREQLFDSSLYILSPLAVLTLMTAISVFCLGIFALIRERGSVLSAAFSLVSVTIFVWLFCYSRMYSAVDGKVAMWWARHAYFGIAYIPTAVFYFSAQVRGDKKSRKATLMLLALSTFFVLTILNTDMVFGALYHYRWGYYPKYGITSIPFLLYFFGVMVYVGYCSWSDYRNSVNGSVHQLRSKAVLVSFIFGYLPSFDFCPAYGIDLYPLGYVTILLFVVSSGRAIMRRQLLSITSGLAAHQILDTMQEALIVLDLDGVIRLVNKETCVLFGYREEELVGSLPSATMINSIAFAEALESCLKGGMIINIEIPFQLTGRGFVTFNLTTSVVRDIMGQPMALVCLMRDVTERKKAEEEREKLITELRNALANVKQLSDMLPICSYCKKIRDDKGYWEGVETYISKNTNTLFSHGMCPECEEKVMKEFEEVKKKSGR